jgi:putative oxidoreductase
MKTLRSLLTLIARLFLSAIFIFSGVGKLIFYDQTHAYMAAKGFTAIPFFLISAALLELIFGFCLLLGYKARFVAGILFLFLIPTSIIFHNFWMHEGADRALQQILFLKNIAIMGGLLYVLCDGPGGFSLDWWTRKKEHEVDHRA